MSEPQAEPSLPQLFSTISLRDVYLSSVIFLSRIVSSDLLRSFGVRFRTSEFFRRVGRIILAWVRFIARRLYPHCEHDRLQSPSF
jgi:hypothetical protein